MPHDTSNSPADKPFHKPRTNWHEAAVCAVQITLRDYEHLLEYLTEYKLGHNAYRIDLLVIRKLSETDIPHPIARIFRSHNLFEIKGIRSSVNITAYYKTIAYASLLIVEKPKLPPHQRQDISLSFLCHRIPKKLFHHLKKDCKKSIANPHPGIYYIIEDIYPVQVIVTRELPPEDALYLRCLTDKLADQPLVDRLVADYSSHLKQPVYEKYMNQLTNANLNPKGESPMAICCEGIFRLYGTSSQEFYDKGYAQATADITAQITKQVEEKAVKQAEEIARLQDEIAHLKALLDAKE